jgi:prophage tail gpP-like protein
MSGASVNNPYAVGYSYRPRVRALMGGVVLPTPIDTNVESNGYFQADRFTVSFSPTLTGTGNIDWWSKLEPTSSGASASSILDIQIGILANGASESSSIAWSSIIQGEVDSFSYSAESNTITATGRDLTARMIDTKTQNAYVNQTSSEIAQKIGAAHGLQVKAKATTTAVGRYWDAEHDNLQLNQFHSVTTEWDLVTTLAKFEGFDAFVATPQGGSPTLYFQPQTAPDATPYTFVWKMDGSRRQTGNVKGLHLERSLTIAKGVLVTVKSWNSKEARSFTKTAGKAKGPSSQNHIYIRPNMTEDQAQQLANSIYNDIVAHEMKISATLPGDLLLTPQSIIKLVGTGSSFDQVYFPQTISRHIGMGGFSMAVTAKNSRDVGGAKAI